MRKLLTKWRRSHTYFLGLFILCLLIQLLQLSEVTRFDRVLIGQGEAWLLLTGNLAHLNWSHLWLNMAGLGLVAIFFGAYMSVLNWLTLSAWSALLVGLGLYYFNVDIVWYVGMSGVLHGLFVVGGWYEYRHYKTSGLVWLGLIVVKLIWEQWAGALPGSESMAGGHVVVDAHLYGGMAGGVFLLVKGWFYKLYN
jgi:rhomboid family GlyGly-CTERM serine protease